MSSSPPLSEAKVSVRRFWDDRPCGSKHAASPEGTPEFFAEVERTRLQLEPFIASFADFTSARDQRVIEVGTGLGTDLIRFARAGAHVVGVDLSEHSVSLARRRLALESLPGEVVVGDAERLPFTDDSFDVAYSWGVLHHTPDTARAAQELLRVLHPDGRFCVMLYARISWVSLGLWARYAALRGKPGRSLSDVLAHHMESEGTKAYREKELRQLFAGARDLRIDRVVTPYDRRVAGPLTRLSGSRLGWFAVIRGRAAAHA